MEKAILDEPCGKLHRIVIVGGGAAGMELATCLGRKHGRKKKAEIMLVDSHMTHIWKPLLHEVAAGTLSTHEDEVNYQMQAYRYGFSFRYGQMDGLDPVNRTISLIPPKRSAHIPHRRISYNTLILAVGSVGNDFGIPGIQEHCHMLDHHMNAGVFHEELLGACYTAQISGQSEDRLHVAIAGGGASGVELAAELHNAVGLLVDYGLDRLSRDNYLHITLIEGNRRVLPMLPERSSEIISKQLDTLGVKIQVNERIVKATEDGFHTNKGAFIPAHLKVWAAGVKGPDFLAHQPGLSVTDRNQIIINENLQVPEHPDIYAIGDCAACPWPGHPGLFVPPRAQAAHQQANHMLKSIGRLLQGQQPLPYHYRDYGTLVNLSQYSTIGNLMGNVVHRWHLNVFIEGYIARLFYLSLYKMHQVALQGVIRTLLQTMADWMRRGLKPLVKLH